VFGKVDTFWTYQRSPERSLDGEEVVGEKLGRGGAWPGNSPGSHRGGASLLMLICVCERERERLKRYEVR
jgi:hypothetical protein